MRNLLDKNWIRIRFLKKRHLWTVQMKKLDKRRKDYMYKFANELIGSSRWKNTDINIMPNTGRTISHSAREISDDILYNVNECFDTENDLEWEILK